MEMVINTLTKTARFEQRCGPAAASAAVKEDQPIAFRAYDGALRQRQEVAVVVVPAISDSCVERSPHHLYWTPFVEAVDGHHKLLGPDRKTGKERQMDFPRNCVTCDECLRMALSPGVHTMTVGVWTWGSVAPDRKHTDVQRVVQFAAQAGGLYAIRACQPGPENQPLFWVRDEATLRCVSATCPGEPQR
ncbi:MAG TPA: hypothetical protein VMT87_02915 [Vicinamibacteria bacterium]|nr:hypothetical protein [Vicinamibacteria bacterium]